MSYSYFIKCTPFFIIFLWLLGLEQYFFIILLPLLLAGVFLRKSQDSLPFPNKKIVTIFNIFLLISFLSLFKIVESFRYLTFARDYLTYIAFILNFIIVSRFCTTFEKVIDVLFTLTLFLFILNLFSLTYFIVGDWGFSSIFSNLLPESISSSTTGQNIQYKTIGRELYFFGLIDYRIKSMFSSGIHYAAILITMIPVMVYMLVYEKRFRNNIILLLTILSSIVLLFYTQSRTAIFLFLITPLLYFFINLFFKGKGVTRLSFIFILSVFVFMGAFALYLNFDTFANMYDQVFIQARKNSAESRMLIYSLTVQGVFQEPFFGWGTQRDVAVLAYPVGSHNWYLSVLYKHGIFAFIFFILFIYLLVSSVIKKIHLINSNFYLYLLLSLSLYLGVALTLEPIVDAISMYFFSILSALSICKFQGVVIPPKNNRPFK